MKNAFQSGLDSLNLFGMNSSSGFYVRGKRKVFSYPGLFLSLAIIIFLVVITIIFFVALFNRHSPFVNQSDLKGVIDQEPLYINTGDNSSFNFLVQFQYNGVPWAGDPSYFTIHAYYIEPNTDKPGYYIKYETALEESFFPAANMTGFWIAPNNTATGEPIFVSGHDNTVHHIVELEVYPCDNATSSVTCAPQEDIDNVMYKTLIWVYYNDWSVDSTNFHNPLAPYLRTFYMYLGPWQTKYLRMDLTQIQFSSDDSYFFDSNRSQNVVTLESSTFDSGDRLYYSDMYAKVTIYSSGNQVVYNRKYKKIQDVLADLTGIASFLIPVAAFLIFPYVQIKMRETLVNDCFYIVTKNGSSFVLKEPPNNMMHTYENQGEKTDPNTSKSKYQNAVNNRQKNRSKKDDASKKMPEKSIISTQKKYERIDSLATLIPFPDIEDGKQDSQKIDNPVVLDVPDNPNNNDVKLNKNTKIELCPLPPVNSRQEQAHDVMIDSDHIAISQDKGYSIISYKASEKPKKACVPSSLDDLEAIEHNLQSNLEFKEKPPENRREQEVPSNQKIVPPPKYKKRKIGVSFCRWALSFCRPHPDVKILRKAEDKLLRELDLISMCKKISEIDKLKACLLTREQRILFDNLSTPLIFYDPDADMKSDDAIKIENWYEPGTVSEDDVKVAYSILKECDTDNAIDKKLLSIYEQRFQYNKYDFSSNA